MTACTATDSFLHSIVAPWIPLERLVQIERSAQHLHLRLDVAVSLLHHPEHYTHSLHALASSAMSHLVNGALQPGFTQHTIALHASLVEATPYQTLQIHARLGRQGRSISFAEATVYNSENNVITHYQGTYALLSNVE